MATGQFNEDRQAIIGSLSAMPTELATRVICILALGAVSILRKDYSQWPKVEQLVFNATMLLFCTDELANDDLAEVINYGIQIDDLMHFTNDPVRFQRIADDVRDRALRLFSGAS